MKNLEEFIAEYIASVGGAVTPAFLEDRYPSLVVWLKRTHNTMHDLALRVEIARNTVIAQHGETVGSPTYAQLQELEDLRFKWGNAAAKIEMLQNENGILHSRVGALAQMPSTEHDRLIQMNNTDGILRLRERNTELLNENLRYKAASGVGYPEQDGALLGSRLVKALEAEIRKLNEQLKAITEARAEAQLFIAWLADEINSDQRHERTVDELHREFIQAMVNYERFARIKGDTE
jgi:hypothetical protein